LPHRRNSAICTFRGAAGACGSKELKIARRKILARCDGNFTSVAPALGMSKAVTVRNAAPSSEVCNAHSRGP